MNFKNWAIAKEQGEELNLFTKAYLKEKYNRKPLKDAKSYECKVYTGGRWKAFDFYKMEDTVEIKSRIKKEIIELEINDENIFKALYVINKSAKKSRDSKTKNYFLENYGIVSRCKSRQLELYELKDMVIKKAISDKKLSFEGFHIQKINEENNYLKLYKGGNFQFHILTNVKPNGDFLGEINGAISSEAKVNTKITYTQSIDLLYRYLNLKNEGEN